MEDYSPMKKQKRARGGQGMDVIFRAEAGVIAFKEGLRCHFPHQGRHRGMNLVEEPFVTCVQGHIFCRHHMDIVCGIDVLNCPDEVKEAFATGCPVCRRVCPCERCTKERGEEPGPQAQNPPRLVFAYKLQDRPMVNDIVDAVRIPVDKFTDELFEKYVIQERVPLILTNMMQGNRLTPALWDLPAQLHRLGDAACPEKSLCQVRIQGMSSKDAGAYSVLEELRDRDPREFFNQTVMGGAQGRLATSEFFSDTEYGKCVWYVKDWSFNEFQPEWGTELMNALPERLRPGNPMDLLSGLEGVQRVDVHMAYIGAAGTRTPLHQDKAGSIAFNCVTWAENEDACKKWWMFHPQDRMVLDAFIQETVKQPGAHLAEDSHWLNPIDFSTITGLRHKVFSFEQRAGELVIVPPNAAHCVMNQGGLTFAVAANIIDASVACEALQVESRNKKLHVASVYKVSGAIWGSMLSFRQRTKNPVPAEILEACRKILATEKKGLKLVGNILLCDAKKLEQSREFLNMVTCDNCKTDIFNAHLIDCAKSNVGKIYCLRKDCVQMAKEWVHNLNELRIMAPRSLEELEAQLADASQAWKE